MIEIQNFGSHERKFCAKGIRIFAENKTRKIITNDRLGLAEMIFLHRALRLTLPAGNYSRSRSVHCSDRLSRYRKNEISKFFLDFTRMRHRSIQAWAGTAF